MDGELDRFFEPPVRRCPICGGARLTSVVTTTDLLQYKPGRFQLERCGGCGLVFQNPRLSARGLEFYYRGFYSGPFADGVAQHLERQGERYRARARLLEGVFVPQRWLDVGSGFGHFCAHAREIWPETRFHALDLSPRLRDAERRGWVERAYCGAFLLRAEALRANDYDVISMFHYLEHSADPRAEISAAARLLAEGGWLLLELPDPDSLLGRLLGRFWLSWFQPQHLNLLSTTSVEILLEEAGFEAVAWERAAAHDPVDLRSAAQLFLGVLAPPEGQPDLPPESPSRRWLRPLVERARVPAALLGAGADRLLAPLWRRPGWSNCFRVVARRRAG